MLDNQINDNPPVPVDPAPVGVPQTVEATPPEGPKLDPKAAIAELRRTATLLQYRHDGKDVDALPGKVERLPDLPGNFAELPDHLRTWLHTQLSELGQDGILHHLAIQMLSNNRLAGRIRELDAFLHTGNRRERRARIKKMVRKGVDLTHGV